MIDIETLGVNRDAPVLSIGACFFDASGIGAGFYSNLDVTEQIDSGLRKVNASTIKWWMSQEDAAKKVFREKASSPKAALECFQAWLLAEAGYKDVTKTGIKPWGNGCNFDIEIMESLFTAYGIAIPWSFRDIRDFRTFKEHVYAGYDVKRKGTQHNALDDAIYQAEVVIKGLELKNGNFNKGSK